MTGSLIIVLTVERFRLCCYPCMLAAISEVVFCRMAAGAGIRPRHGRATSQQQPGWEQLQRESLDSTVVNQAWAGR